MRVFAANVPVQFQLRPIEAKLLTLALDPAARGNEIATSAEKIISSLRARGVSTAEVFVGPKASPVGDDLTPIRARNMRMPFGKYRRKRLCDVPLNYLSWAKDNCKNMTPGLRHAITMILHET